MKADLEAQLTESMHHKVDGIALTSDILGRATKRHRRRAATTRIGYALGAAGLAGLAAGITLGSGATPQHSPGNGPVVQARTASVRLASAVAASNNISYRMRLTSYARTAGGRWEAVQTFEGAFDPKTATGYVRSSQDDAVITELLINGTRYIGAERPLRPLPPDKAGMTHEKYGRYGQYPGKHDRLSLYDDTVLGAAAPDPTALLKALKNASATIRQRSGTLHFEYTTQTVDGSITTSGDVTLNADGRIDKVTLTGRWQSTAKGRLQKGTFRSALKLFDYGLKVKVQRPADVVPAS
jgi:hypothetical protein